MGNPRFGARSNNLVDRARVRHFVEADQWLVPLSRLVAGAMAPAAVIEDGYKLCIYQPPEHRRQIRFFTDQIEMALADGLHNLRAALDCLACELASRNGGEADSRLYFPIVNLSNDRQAQDAQWRRGTKDKFPLLDPELLQRLKDVQVFSSPPLWIPNALEVVHRLDIDNKHRFGMEVGTFPILGNADHSQVDESDPAAFQARNHGAEWRVNLYPQPRPPMNLWLEIGGVRVALFTPFGSGAMSEAWQTLCDDVDRCIHYIATGEWKPPAVIGGLSQGDEILQGDAAVPLKELYARGQHVDHFTAGRLMPRRIYESILAAEQAAS